MRDNNRYYVDYIRELEEQGITPEMEVDDIVKLIEGNDELTDLKYKLRQFKANLLAGVLVRVGRKNLKPAEYLQTFMLCYDMRGGFFNKVSDGKDKSKRYC